MSRKKFFELGRRFKYIYFFVTSHTVYSYIRITYLIDFKNDILSFNIEKITTHKKVIITTYNFYSIFTNVYNKSEINVVPYFWPIVI